MSLILDALNRSRRDTGEAPGLAAQHYPDGDSPGHWGASRWRARLPWLALVAALLVIAALLLERESGDRPAVAATAGPGIVSSPATSPDTPRATIPRPPVAAAPPASAPAGASPHEPATASRTTSAVSLPMASDAVVAAAAPASRARDEVAVEALYRQPEAAVVPGKAAAASPPATTDKSPSTAAAAEPAPTQPEEQAIDIEQLLQRAQGELANAQLTGHPVPFLEELSQQTKDGIPTILYTRHDYSSDPGRATATLNGVVLRVGDGGAVPGLTVEEILVDSVVLNYRGVRFRLRALNSWVNL